MDFRASDVAELLNSANREINRLAGIPNVLGLTAGDFTSVSQLPAARLVSDESLTQPAFMTGYVGQGSTLATQLLAGAYTTQGAAFATHVPATTLTIQNFGSAAQAPASAYTAQAGAFATHMPATALTIQNFGLATQVPASVYTTQAGAFATYVPATALTIQGATLTGHLPATALSIEKAGAVTQFPTTSLTIQNSVLATQFPTSGLSIAGSVLRTQAAGPVLVTPGILTSNQFDANNVLRSAASHMVQQATTVPLTRGVTVLRGGTFGFLNAGVLDVAVGIPMTFPPIDRYSAWYGTRIGSTRRAVRRIWSRWSKAFVETALAVAQGAAAIAQALADFATRLIAVAVKYAHSHSRHWTGLWYESRTRSSVLAFAQPSGNPPPLGVLALLRMLSGASTTITKSTRKISNAAVRRYSISSSL